MRTVRLRHPLVDKVLIASQASLPFFFERAREGAASVVQVRLPELENAAAALMLGQTQAPTAADTIEMLLARVKENLLASFGTLLAQYSDDVRRMDAQRISQGWNYGHFFTLKVRHPTVKAPRQRARPSARLAGRWIDAVLTRTG